MNENHSDNLDVAAEYMLMDIDHAINNVLSNMPPQLSKEERNKIIHRTCEECGNEIPAERIRAYNARLCIDCARAIELANKVYRGFHHE